MAVYLWTTKVSLIHLQTKVVLFLLRQRLEFYLHQKADIFYTFSGHDCFLNSHQIPLYFIVFRQRLFQPLYRKKFFISFQTKVNFFLQQSTGCFLSLAISCFFFLRQRLSLISSMTTAVFYYSIVNSIFVYSSGNSCFIFPSWKCLVFHPSFCFTFDSDFSVVVCNNWFLFPVWQWLITFKNSKLLFFVSPQATVICFLP